jgi:hypothetical protein
VNRTDLPIDAMIKFETRAPMRSVRRGQSLIILWWAVGPFRKFPNPKGQIDIWILGIKFALMNSPYYKGLAVRSLEWGGVAL